MSEDLQDKTEEASPKKLRDSRAKGQVARSQDLTSAVILMTGMVTLYVFGEYFFDRLSFVMIAALNNLNEPIDTPGSVVFWFRQGMIGMVTIISPLFAILVVMALLVNVAQVQIVFSADPLKPKWKKVNIFNVENYKKFFDVQALTRLAFGFSKLTVIGAVCYLLIMRCSQQIGQLINGETSDVLNFLAYQGFLIGFVAALILLILGLAEFSVQRWKFNSDQKMSKQETKEERKQTEGDPQVKSKMRSMMQQFTRSRMKDNVPKADVIIANPIHYAVAIKYDADTMPAPMCVAKGARKMALSIREIAEENKVPIVENPLLARGLFQTVEVGMYVPPDMYHPIAEVLAYVYRLDEEMSKRLTKKGSK